MFDLNAWLPLIYTAVITVILISFLLTTLANLALFPRLKKTTAEPNTEQSVSILIPARNEAAVINQTISRIVQQTYTQFELIILDDQSTDNTADIVHKWGKKDGRVKLISGEPIASGWLGKNWACHQLANAAQKTNHDSTLIFIDADVQWEPDALQAVLSLKNSTNADLLTVWPTQNMGTWTEFLVVPLMKFAIMSYLPIIGVHFTPYTAFAAANGQCMVFNRHAYEKIGGHTAVRDQIIEDVALAKATKQASLRLRMADGASLISCRMYNDWTAVRQGFGKNILAGHGNSVPFLLLSTLFHLAAFVFPWVWLIFGGGVQALWLIGLSSLLRFISEWAVDRKLGRALFAALVFPISVLLMTRIAVQSLVWHFGDGPQWKGRTLQTTS